MSEASHCWELNRKLRIAAHGCIWYIFYLLASEASPHCGVEHEPLFCRAWTYVIYILLASEASPWCGGPMAVYGDLY